MVKKNKKNDGKYCVITSVNVNLGIEIFEAGKEYTMDEKSIEFLKNTFSYKKGRVQITKLD